MLMQLGLSPHEEAGSAHLVKSMKQQLSLVSLCVFTSSFELKCRGFGFSSFPEARSRERGKTAWKKPSALTAFLLTAH